ncbi:ATP-binding protein [Ignavibacteriales bacterium]
MVASNYDKTTFEEENVAKIPKQDIRLLKTAAIFGSNASGKSQLLNALTWLRYFVVSGGSSRNEKLDIPRFRLDEFSGSNPSSFTIIFLQNNKIFEYGIVLGTNVVIEEWLNVWITNRKTSVFHRAENGLKSSPLYFKVGKIIQKANQVKGWNSYLTKAFEYEQLGNELILEVRGWFEGLRTFPGNDPAGFEVFMSENHYNAAAKERLLGFIRNADFSIEDVVLDKSKGSLVLPESKESPPVWVAEVSQLLLKVQELIPDKTVVELKTKHKRLKNDGSYDVVEFSRSEESAGTVKFIALAGPIWDVLIKGGILLVDELDTQLHPNLVKKIIEEFNSKERNPKSAQLIFNSHNTATLGNLRRDQIWFTKKDGMGVATVEPLSDYKYGPRKEENLEGRYLDGRFGAVPYLGKFGIKAS